MVVWQDFMFACSMFELTRRLRREYPAGLIDNIKRLRHQRLARIVVSRNNEMEWLVDDKRYQRTPKQYSDYIRMYEHMFPRVLGESTTLSPLLARVPVFWRRI